MSAAARTPLVERDATLATLRQCLLAAAQRGHVALVAGEAGIGKTSVLRTMADEHATRGPVWWGACDALETPHPLAPLLDIARDQRPRFSPAISGPRPALFEAVLDELRLAPAPVFVVIEDAHWADEATLDLLKFIGRRIDRAKAVLAISYRDDEVGLSHPLRRVLGELPPAHRTLIEVPRLTVDGVRALAEQFGGRADGVYEATRGNAFFATEVLRDTAVPRAAVPRTVQDVVLARFARLPPAVQSLLQLVSIVPGRIERWLVDALLASPLADLEAALASGLLLADGAFLSYRHELARVAVESSLSPPLAQSLHRRVLQALQEPERDGVPARLVHHALAARDEAAIHAFAPRAAREATGRGAHREAAAQWRTALEHGRPRDDTERAEWLTAYVGSCSVVGWLEQMLAALRELHALAHRNGDLAGAARARAWQASPYVGLLRNDEANAAVREALALVGTLEPAGAAHAFVWSMACYQRMLDRDYAESVEWGRRSIALAEALGEGTIRDRAELSAGAALLFVDLPAGREMLLKLLARRRAEGSALGAFSVLSMIGSGMGEVMQLAEAEGYLREAVTLAETHDFNGAYSKAWLALCLVATGRWEEATVWAAAVLSKERESNIARLMALLALGRVRLRRGDPGVAELLDEANTLAQDSRTLQRMAPTACARAEWAFGRARLDDVRAEVERVLPLAQSKGHPWFVGELNYWLWRAGFIDAGPAGCAEPHALEMAGQWQAAADAWQRLGCPFERARALALGDLPARQEALALFEQLGARPAAEALRRQLREAGVRGIARGARASTRGNPAGLTAAEMQVLALMAQDLRNAEIAARLHRSVRTVDHHVAAVLAKLGVPSRLEAVRHAERAGWLDGAPGSRALPAVPKNRQSTAEE